MANGILSLGLIELFFVVLLLTHVTTLSASIYLHRYSAHQAFVLHPLVVHFFRFWLWLTTAVDTRAWTAIHRKHHAKCETDEDPHSPWVYGLRKLFLEGNELYQSETSNTETIERYGFGCPDDWLEKNLYRRFPHLGLLILLFVNVILFGALGLTVWSIQVLWMPVIAGGLVNGVAHLWGYRNFKSADASRNISPIGVLVGGEELHNNHHGNPRAAKLSVRWFEIDVGWFWIRSLELLGLAQVPGKGKGARIGYSKSSSGNSG